MQTTKPITVGLPVSLARTMDNMNHRLEKLTKSLEDMADKLSGGGGGSFGGLSLGGGGGGTYLDGIPRVSTDFKAFLGELLGDVTGNLTAEAPGILGEKKEGEKKEGDGTSEVAKTATADAQKEETDAAIKAEEEREKANAKAWAGIVGNAIKSSKALAKIRKAFAIGGVVMDTAQGIAKAVASAPFPANLPAIAFATVTGAAQLAAIKGQAHDGINNIPTTGTYLLEKGERVVDKRLNADLTQFLATGRGGLRGAQGLSNTTTNTLAPSIHLSIGPDTPPDAVHRNRGALESMIREIFADYALEAPFG
jgi:hypothetical protein